jgi:hypothetical protein
VVFDPSLIQLAIEESLRAGARVGGSIGLYAAIAGFALRFYRSIASSQDGRISRVRIKRLEDFVLKHIGMELSFPIQEQFVTWPNFTKGRGSRSVKGFVMHWTVGSFAVTIAECRNPLRQVSYHYVIDRDGSVVQLVSTDNTAHHCGVWTTNQETISIACVAGYLENGARVPANDIQIARAKELVAYNANRFMLSLNDPTSFRTASGSTKNFFSRVIGHRDVKATVCPGSMSPDEIKDGALAVLNKPVDSITLPNPKYRFTVNVEPSQVYSDEVVRIQEFLVQQGHLHVSALNYKGYYGKLTREAVNKFQLSVGILSSPQYFGYWFDKTRAAANKINGY